MPKTIWITRGGNQYRVKHHAHTTAIEREVPKAAGPNRIQLFAATAYDGTAWNWPVVNTLIDQYERVIAHPMMTTTTKYVASVEPAGIPDSVLPRSAISNKSPNHKETSQ